MNHSERPIGIFDSGIGGLSVLRHIHKQLPNESLCYFADSGFAPYGEKPEEVVIRRSMEIAYCLFSGNCKALVVACNTATAMAVHLLREAWPDMPIVGIEPGLKPAAAMTKSRTVGVLATERTLKSSKFQKLRQFLSEQTGVRFIAQACPGLADLVEKNEHHSDRAMEFVRNYTLPLIAQNADTIVLGCTHYPFLQDAIEKSLPESVAKEINIIDTGVAVTNQLIRLLDDRHPGQIRAITRPKIHALTTGSGDLLAERFEQLLHIRPDVTQMTTDRIVFPHGLFDKTEKRTP